MNKRDTIAILNHALKAEYTEIYRYMHQHFIVTGPNREPIREALERIAREEMKHAGMLAEKIVALGGTPVTELEKIGPDERTVEAMLKANAARERRHAASYARQANALPQDEVALRLMLEELCAESVQHAERWDILSRKFG